MKVLIGIVIAISLLILLRTLYVYHTWHPFMPKIRKGKKLIICVGDSITYGAGVIPWQKKQSYPAYLQKLLGENYQVVNAGMSGRTLLQSGDLPYIREKNYPKTFQAGQAVYLCMLGTNDSKPYNWDEEGFRREMEIFLKKYVAVVGNKAVFVMKPPKAFCMEGNTMPVYDIRDEIILMECGIIEEVAKKLSVSIIDLYQLTQTHKEWFPDGVHPNAEGNQQIAGYIYRNIREKGMMEEEQV